MTEEELTSTSPYCRPPRSLGSAPDRSLAATMCNRLGLRRPSLYSTFSDWLALLWPCSSALSSCASVASSSVSQAVCCSARPHEFSRTPSQSDCLIKVLERPPIFWCKFLVWRSSSWPSECQTTGMNLRLPAGGGAFMGCRFHSKSWSFYCTSSFSRKRQLNSVYNLATKSKLSGQSVWSTRRRTQKRKSKSTSSRPPITIRSLGRVREGMIRCGALWPTQIWGHQPGWPFGSPSPTFLPAFVLWTALLFWFLISLITSTNPTER